MKPLFAAAAFAFLAAPAIAQVPEPRTGPPKLYSAPDRLFTDQRPGAAYTITCQAEVPGAFGEWTDGMRNAFLKEKCGAGDLDVRRLQTLCRKKLPDDAANLSEADRQKFLTDNCTATAWAGPSIPNPRPAREDRGRLYPLGR